MEPIAHLRVRQDGVLTRRQLLTSGLSPNDVRRQLRRRDLTPVHPGVYVDHTGPLTAQQRRWAGVLSVWPAALSHGSALPQATGTEHPVHVSVERERSPRVTPPWVRLHHTSDLAQRVRWSASPPRVRVEHASLDVAAGLTEDMEVLEVLASVVRSRHTTAARLLDALGSRPRHAGRELVEGLLRDIADGTCSVLEREYRVRVEEPHGLPPAARQLQVVEHGRSRYRDVDYAPYGVVVELDGRTFHADLAQHDDDLERDLATALDRRTTVRVGWGQVFRRACRTAGRIGTLLQVSGWPGSPRTCPECRPGDVVPRIGAAG